MSKQEKQTYKRSFLTRVLAILLTVLVASSVVVYLVSMFINLFSDSSEEESGSTESTKQSQLLEPEEETTANAVISILSFESPY